MHPYRHGRHKPFREDNRSKPDNHVAYEMVQDNDRPISIQSKESASWTLELITLTLSVLFIAAQVALLVWVRDKPYYETWKFRLSINTVLAILTTACKTAQLHAVGEAIGQVKWVDFKTAPRRLSKFEIYDSTSRGPQGAVQFVLRVRWGLATVGAFVVLLALAADPFTQQVIHLEPRNVTTPDDTAIFGFTHKYDTNPNQTAFSSVLLPEITTRDPGMQGAILKGIFNIESLDEFQCGGACSWNGTYTSLGFSSTCNSITQIGEATKICDKEGPASTKVCNYTTPGGVFFSTEYVPTDSSTALRVAVNDTFFPTVKKGGNQSIAADFLKAAVFQASNNVQESSFNDPDIIPANITDCSLSLSLYEYSEINANGSQLQYHSTSQKLKPGWYHADNPFAPAIITFNQSESGPIDPPVAINSFDLANAILFFESSAFTSHIITGNNLDQTEIGNGAAFLNKDVPGVFGALAKSMTDYVRSLSKGPNVQPVHGARVEQVVFVQVRWEWLILPLFEELAAVVFVVWVIVYNSRHGVPGWKSSALAVLAHSLNHDNSLVTKYQGPKEVMKRAKQIEVHLQ
ncbi:hypothetical protein HD806DRAFT_291932 [Xylariaceae sp. AK1471]|nr:hypothetical protein HD806DRAFT_291932 [Xylariaceae sp. AK1471]